MDKLNKFLLYLENEKRFSKNTIDAYKRDLIEFTKHLQKEHTQQVDELIVKNYLAFLYSKRLTKRTISRKISSLKSYYKFLEKKFNQKNDFIKEVKCPKRDKTLPDMLYKDELKKILSYIHEGNFKYRNKTIIYLLYTSGIRLSELCNITISSINLENRYLIVTGKGNKTRICPFNTKCKKAIQDYIHFERNPLAKETDALIINKYGNKISPRAIEDIIKNISLKLFGNTKLHPHIFRHTYATNLLNGGADIKIVQELLGHSSLITTQIYTHLAKEEISKIYNVSHPREKNY